MMVKNPIKYALLLDKVYEGEQIRCPECGKEGLQHRFFAEGRIGFAQFRCPHCDAEAHLSRVRFPEDISTEPLYSSDATSEYYDKIVRIEEESI